MKLLHSIVYVFLFINLNVNSRKMSAPIEYHNSSDFYKKFGGNVHLALFDIVKGFPAYELNVICDNQTDGDFIELLFKTFYIKPFVIKFFNITTLNWQDEYFRHLEQTYENYLGGYTLYMCNNMLKEHILLELYDKNIIRRNIISIFYWGNQTVDRYFLRGMYAMMRIVVLTNPRPHVYRIYYNQGTAHQKHHLTLINWWIAGYGLYQHPTLPPALKVFKNFNGKSIDVPVVHKPPWHFVHYDNDSIQVLGGRDDQLLILLAKTLNFKYKYFDPPDRSQGTTLSPNGTFEGILGQIWRREVEFFIGDVAITTDRNKVVEFSFVTLADSGAFVTHTPRRLNEAVALVRPFRMEVWPVIFIAFSAAGPVLYALLYVPNTWRPEFIVRSKWMLFSDCVWLTTTLFFKQTGNLNPYQSHKTRCFVILLCLCTTYIIAGMYSANLISLLARPGREKAINTLQQLEKAMTNKENGTGVYKRLWQLMTKNQAEQFVKSVEEGVKMIKDNREIALLAGRETLFFDTQRFGSKYFHLSEKLSTAYNALAFQIGSPYIENVNRILMALFEAGILTKMTDDEYENLGKQEAMTEKLSMQSKKKDSKTKAKEDNDNLQPINIKMLQGAFYVLIIGLFFSGVTLGLEITFYRYGRYLKRQKRKMIIIRKIKQLIRWWIRRIIRVARRRLRREFNEAIIKTFDYIE